MVFRCRARARARIPLNVTDGRDVCWAHVTRVFLSVSYLTLDSWIHTIEIYDLESRNRTAIGAFQPTHPFSRCYRLTDKCHDTKAATKAPRTAFTQCGAFESDAEMCLVPNVQRWWNHTWQTLLSSSAGKRLCHKTKQWNNAINDTKYKMPPTCVLLLSHAHGTTHPNIHFLSISFIQSSDFGIMSGGKCRELWVPVVLI